MRERIVSVRRSLRELSAMLAQRPGVNDVEFVLAAPVAGPSRPKHASAATAKAAVKRAPKKK